MERVKVFLVEDEIVIRNGIKKSIDWEKEGYEFVGEASDGELAYPMILKGKPDILITDIKMPFMDGLELSKLVKKELPDIKILILSGYDEFNYAKEAIRIGVTEYLLKPISAAKLLDTLAEVSKKIFQERQEKELLKQYSEEMKENTEHEKLRLFHKLIVGEMSMAEAVWEGKKYGMNLSAPCYRILLFKVLSGMDNGAASEKMVAACNAVESELSKIPFLCAFQRGVDGWAFLLTAEDEKEMEANSREVERILTEIMDKWKGIEYFGGIGTTVERIRNLGSSFREADKAFAGRFTLQANQIMSADALQAKQKEELTMKGFVEIGKSREMIEKFLNNGTQEEVQAFAEAYIARIEEDHIRSTLMRQYVVMDICIAILSFCEHLSASEELQKEAEELQNAMQRIHSLEEIRNYMIRLLNDAIVLRDTVSGRRYSDIIMAAQEKISKSYMSENISLNSVAVSVGMSPSYFSSIFSKEVGKTFVEYLTEVRMDKAKELLMCSAMKTSEIGFEVGYKDPHYFSYIFKKTQRCSPKEYRARRKE